jgi:hypothetical protein
MRTRSFCSVFLFIILMLLISACRKKDDGTLTFDYRVISETVYSNNLLVSATAMEYENDKILRVTSNYYTNGTASSTEIYDARYPDANTIQITSTITENNQTSTGSTALTFSDNKVTESIDETGSDKNKTTFTYNSDGKIEKIKEYVYSASWILEREQSFSYSSGKLVQVSELEYNTSGALTYEDKYVLSYNGNEMVDNIHSYRPAGGSWSESQKDAYTYTNGKISRITSYYKNGTAWTQSGTEDFTYDSNDNLIRDLSSYSGESYRMEYTYEEGSGNFSQIYEAMGGFYVYIYPIPHKKSLSVPGTARLWGKSNLFIGNKI